MSDSKPVTASEKKRHRISNSKSMEKACAAKALEKQKATQKDLDSKEMAASENPNYNHYQQEVAKISPVNYMSNCPLNIDQCQKEAARTANTKSVSESRKNIVSPKKEALRTANARYMSNYCANMDPHQQ